MSAEPPLDPGRVAALFEATATRIQARVWPQMENARRFVDPNA